MGDRQEIQSRRKGGSSSPLPLAHSPSPGAVRLQKVMADAGVASRRKAEVLILAGRVTVNGRVVSELGTKVDPERDHVKVDGRHLKPVPPEMFVMLHKPKGYLSAMSDPDGRPTIADLLKGVRCRVFPVGRLDFDAEGLILLTNHGTMAQALLHPRYHVPKTYLVKVKGILTGPERAALEAGVQLDDGPTGPAKVTPITKATQNSWVELTIHEGRKHQVKRMLDSIGHPVIKLKRVRFGPLALGELPVGEYRYVTDREANALRDLVRKRTAGQGLEAIGSRKKPSKNSLRGSTGSPSPIAHRRRARRSAC